MSKETRKRTFNSVKEMLEHAFPGHKIIEHDGCFYAEIVSGATKITLRPMDNVSISKYQLDVLTRACDIVEGKASPHELLAPPHYNCPKCKIVCGLPISRRGTTGRGGQDLHCSFCDFYLGADPDFHQCLT